MFINHLIVGSQDVPKTTEFYCELLGFKKSDDDPGAKGGQVLINDQCELLLIPFPKEKLPNPAHFAFEVNSIVEFKNILEKAKQMNLGPRTWPAKDSEKGTTIFKRGSSTYELFYLNDPNGVNLEVMVKV